MTRYALFGWRRSSRFTASDEMLSEISDETFDGARTFIDFRFDLTSVLHDESHGAL